MKLPRLTREVNCEPLGYPGIVLTLWLNVDDADWKPPEDAQKWDRYGYWWQARIIDSVTIPGTYTDDGEDVTYEITDQKAVYDMMTNTPGFDAYILVWAIEAWRQKRAEWLASAVKN